MRKENQLPSLGATSGLLLTVCCLLFAVCYCFEIVNRPLQPFMKGDRRIPIEQRLGARDVGLALFGSSCGNGKYSTPDLDPQIFHDLFRQLFDSKTHWGSQVDRVMYLIKIHQPYQGFNQVIYITE